MKFFPQNFWLALLVTLLSSGTSLSVQSESIPTRGPIPFADYDKDNNGMISESEFNAAHAARNEALTKEGRLMKGQESAPKFAELDSNKDGQLSPDELMPGQRAQMQKSQSRQTNQDPTMGFAGGRNMPNFSDYDLNGDGTIAEKEFDEARDKRVAQLTAQGRQMQQMGDAPTFQDIDTNKDGKISSDEFNAHQKQRQGQ